MSILCFFLKRGTRKPCFKITFYFTLKEFHREPEIVSASLDRRGVWGATAVLEFTEGRCSGGKISGWVDGRWVANGNISRRSRPDGSSEEEPGVAGVVQTSVIGSPGEDGQHTNISEGKFLSKRKIEC